MVDSSRQAGAKKRSHNLGRVVTDAEIWETVTNPYSPVTRGGVTSKLSRRKNRLQSSRKSSSSLAVA